jgi:hypothetical protein
MAIRKDLLVTEESQNLQTSGQLPLSNQQIFSRGANEVCSVPVIEIGYAIIASWGGR